MYKCTNCKENNPTWLAICPHCKKCNTLVEIPKTIKGSKIRVYSTAKHRKRISLKRVSKQRKPREALYNAEKDIRKASNLRVCFFCGKPITNGVEHHHLLGRVGTSDEGHPLLSYNKNIIDSHPLCHTRSPNSYHLTPISMLPEKPYFKRWIRRIYGINKQMTRLKILHINDAREKEFKKTIKLEDYI